MFHVHSVMSDHMFTPFLCFLHHTVIILEHGSMRICVQLGHQAQKTNLCFSPDNKLTINVSGKFHHPDAQLMINRLAY